MNTIIWCHCFSPAGNNNWWAIATPLFIAVFAFVGNIFYKEIIRKREIIENIYTEIYANCDKMFNSALSGNKNALIYRALSFSYATSVPAKNALTPEENRQKEIGHDYDLKIALTYLEYSNNNLADFNKAVIDLNKNIHLIIKYTDKHIGDKFYNLIIRDENPIGAIVKDYEGIFDKPGLTDAEYQTIYKREFAAINDFVFKGELGKKLNAIKELVLPKRD